MNSNIRDFIPFIIALIISIVVYISMAVFFFVVYVGDDSRAKSELMYWHSKAELIDAIDSFMDSKAPTNNIDPISVLHYADMYEVDVRIFLAQGLVESHYGTKGLAVKTHSVCNLGAWDDGKVRARYKHPNLSLKPYFRLIKEDYLGDDKSEEDLLRSFVNQQGKRYASYPYYERELMIVYNDISKNTKIDSLISIYEHYKLEFNR